MCFGCSKEPSYRDGSFEYPQHMFWLRNKKTNFQLRTLIWGTDYTEFACIVLLMLLRVEDGWIVGWNDGSTMPPKKIPSAFGRGGEINKNFGKSGKFVLKYHQYYHIF